MSPSRADRPVRLTPRGQAFVGAGVVLTLSGLLLGQHDLSRAGVLVLSLLVVAALTVGYRAPSLEVDRVVHPYRVEVDRSATVDLTIRNTGVASTSTLYAEEHLSYALGDRPRFVVAGLRRGEARGTRYSVRAPARGLYDLGPLLVQARDPFGTMTRLVAVRGSGVLLVVPTIHELAQGADRRAGGSTNGGIPHSAALHGEDDQSVRDYRIGDDLRRIHWPATARTDQLMVRQDERQTLREALIVLDQRADAHRGTGVLSTLEWAITMVVSLHAHLLHSGYAVRLLTVDPDLPDGVREDEELDSVLTTLAKAQPAGPDALGLVLHHAHSLAPPNALVVAVTGHLDQAQARQLAGLRSPGATARLITVEPRDPGTADPGALGVLRTAGWDARPVTVTTPPARAWSSARREALR